MSEYIEIETEIGDDLTQMVLRTNLLLTEDAAETYESLEAMEEGSPVAQALAPIEGLRRLHLDRHELTVTRDPDVPWHIIVAEITAALKDFFL